MSKQVQASRASHMWRTVAAGVLVILAAVALVASVLTRYVRDNVLDTNRFVAIVGPLPQKPEVAQALGAFVTEKLFSATNAEQNIANFLPPKLAPLAAPLTDTLQKETNELAVKFVQSDNFDAIWTAAVGAGQKAVLRVAEPSEDDSNKLEALGSVDLQGLIDAVRSRVGSDAVLAPSQPNQSAAVKLKLHQSIDTLQTSVHLVRSGAYALPYVCLALLLAAIAVGYNRRRVVLWIGATFASLAVILLVLCKMVSGQIIADIQTGIYRSAASVIYEAFYSDLRKRLAWIVIVGLLVIVLAWLAGPSVWAIWMRGKLRIGLIKKTTPYNWASIARKYVTAYVVWARWAGVILAAVVLLAMSSLSPSTLTVVVSILTAYESLVQLLVKRSHAA